jgi:F-type H+-transporting ATPase subunit b
MDYKSTIIENAWGGISMDYGLLHVQLATPVATLLIIFVMIFLINQLLFKPVLRTLDKRQQVIEHSRTQVSTITEEMAKLRSDLEEKLNQAQMDAFHTVNEAAEQAHHQKESMILEEMQILEKEVANGHKKLSKEIADAKAILQKSAEKFSEATVTRLLN